jgi:hypothetical protein
VLAISAVEVYHIGDEIVIEVRQPGQTVFQVLIVP